MSEGRVTFSNAGECASQILKDDLSAFRGYALELANHGVDCRVSEIGQQPGLPIVPSTRRKCRPKNALEGHIRRRFDIIHHCPPQFVQRSEDSFALFWGAEVTCQQGLHADAVGPGAE